MDSNDLLIEADQKEMKKRKREKIAIVFLSLFFIVLTIAEIRLTRLSSTLPFVNSIFFFGLLNINIILLIGIFWLIFRNIGKLVIERRRKILGARLKTKLVLAFLAFAITPTLVLFTISSLYINSSFDKWFSLKVQNTLQSSLEITRTYYRNADRNAMHFAKHISRRLGRKIPASTDLSSIDFVQKNRKWIQSTLDTQQNLLALNAVEFYFDPFDVRMIAQRPEEAHSDLPLFYPRLPLDLLEQAFSGKEVPVIQHVGSGDLIRTLVPVYASQKGSLKAGAKAPLAGVIAVSSYIPVSLVNKVDEIASVFDDYKDTNPLKYPIKTAYFIILIMVTLVIIFVAIWIGLFLSREMTVPIERLVQGAKEVGSGNLEVKIESIGHDEISVLVDSFNRMTADLKENRAHLDQARTDLEKRRLQLEAVLANVGTGVIVVDQSGAVITFNRAVSQLLEISPKTALMKKVSEILTGDAAPLNDLIERTLKAPHTNDRESQAFVAQFNYKLASGTQKSLAAVATALNDEDTQWGTVVVIDDMTDLIKAQREVAWREVARRIAHEIKNPLTPIKLSAQRLQRRLDNYAGRESSIVRECTDTIVKHTDELKDMVNEFSNFARLPEISPAAHDLNEAIQEVITLFSQAHPQIQFELNSETRIPIFKFDRDQVKRVVMNLFSNAVSAILTLKHSASRPKVKVQTHYNEQLQMVMIEIGDNGPGMTEEVKSRVFEPYFSTKNEGTGLGLAIAKRIVNDHNGFIRVNSSLGKGTQFLIELPTANENFRKAEIGI